VKRFPHPGGVRVLSDLVDGKKSTSTDGVPGRIRSSKNGSLSVKQ